MFGRLCHHESSFTSTCLETTAQSQHVMRKPEERLTCVDEVGVDVQSGRADASRAAVGVGQAQVRGAQIARGLCLG